MGNDQNNQNSSSLEDFSKQNPFRIQVEHGSTGQNNLGN